MLLVLIIVVVAQILVFVRAWSARKDRTWRQLTDGWRNTSHGHCYYILGRLLTLESHLSRHYALSLGNQIAFGAEAVFELAVALVALEPRDHSVVAAAGTFRLTNSSLTAATTASTAAIRLRRKLRVTHGRWRGLLVVVIDRNTKMMMADVAVMVVAGMQRICRIVELRMVVAAGKAQRTKWRMA